MASMAGNNQGQCQADNQRGQKITGLSTMYHCVIVSPPDMGTPRPPIIERPDNKKKAKRESKQDIGSGELSYTPHTNFERN